MTPAAYAQGIADDVRQAAIEAKKETAKVWREWRISGDFKQIEPIADKLVLKYGSDIIPVIKNSFIDADNVWAHVNSIPELVLAKLGHQPGVVDHFVANFDHVPVPYQTLAFLPPEILQEVLLRVILKEGKYAPRENPLAFLELLAVVADQEALVVLERLSTDPNLSLPVDLSFLRHRLKQPPQIQESWKRQQLMLWMWGRVRSGHTSLEPSIRFAAERIRHHRQRFTLPFLTAIWRHHNGGDLSVLIAGVQKEEQAVEDLCLLAKRKKASLWAVSKAIAEIGDPSAWDPLSKLIAPESLPYDLSVLRDLAILDRGRTIALLKSFEDSKELNAAQRQWCSHMKDNIAKE